MSMCCVIERTLGPPKSSRNGAAFQPGSGLARNSTVSAPLPFIAGETMSCASNTLLTGGFQVLFVACDPCYKRGMDFRLLGPLEVWDRGRPLELTRPKLRALLAFLLLRAGAPVTNDALIDALWGERAPPTARAALQNYVAQLRRVLGPG